MIGAKISLDAKAISEQAKDLHARLAKATLRGAQHLTSVIRREVRETFPRGRTGELARSWREQFVSDAGGVLTAESTSELVYARILDEGGTILPKTVTMLAIPIRDDGPKQTGDWAADRLARDEHARSSKGRPKVPFGKWPRHFQPGRLFLIKSKRGNLLLMARTGKGKRAKMWPMFVLKDKVTIKARRYLDAAQKKAEPDVVKIVEAALFGRKAASTKEFDAKRIK